MSVDDHDPDPPRPYNWPGPGPLTAARSCSSCAFSLFRAKFDWGSVIKSVLTCSNPDPQQFVVVAAIAPMVARGEPCKWLS